MLFWLIPVLVAAGGLLAAHMRVRAAADLPLATAAAPLQRPAAVPQPLAVQALSLAFGLGEEAPLDRQLAFTLKASFTSTGGDSRALVAGADGQQVYRVGDELPGGARLRHIDNQFITLWFNAREHRVSLAGAAPAALRAVDANVPGATPTPSSPRLLRKVP